MKKQLIKFTFKKESPGGAGLYGSPATNIKFKGNVIGYIQCNDSWDYNLRKEPSKIGKENKWQVWFQKEDKFQKCGWKWVAFAKLFKTEPEARGFVGKMSDYIYTMMFKGNINNEHP